MTYHLYRGDRRYTSAPNRDDALTRMGEEIQDHIAYQECSGCGPVPDQHGFTVLDDTHERYWEVIWWYDYWSVLEYRTDPEDTGMYDSIGPFRTRKLATRVASALNQAYRYGRIEEAGKREVR